MFIPPALAFTGSHLLARLADQGAANTSGLTTLRHGTNPLSWLSIHLVGALPYFGGSSFGGDAKSVFGYQNNNRFYMGMDSDCLDGSDHYLKSLSFPQFFRNKIGMRVLPKQYAVNSSTYILEKITKIKPQNTRLHNITVVIPGVVMGLLIPTIKIRVSDDVVESYIPDRSMTVKGVACSTPHWVSPLNLGLVGTLWNSLTPRTIVRMCRHPQRVICGIAELAFCALVAHYTLAAFPVFVAANKTAILAGALLAVI